MGGGVPVIPEAEAHEAIGDLPYATTLLQAPARRARVFGPMRLAGMMGEFVGFEIVRYRGET